MKKNLSRKNIILTSISILLLVIILGVSYAAYSYTQTIGEGKISTGTIDVNYNESKNTLALSKKVPLYDNEGKELEETLDFDVDIKVAGDFRVSYIVTVEKIENLSNIEDKYIKVYLEKSSDGINYTKVNDPKIFEGITEESSFGAPNGSMIIDSGIVTQTTKYYYRLRIWLDGSYSENNVSKDFAVKTNVYSTTEKETLDSNKPVCSFKDINDIKVSKESIVKLECIDTTSGIVEKDLEKADIETINNNIEILSVEKEKITNGIRYNIRVRGLSTGNDTLKLNSSKVEDKLGNTNDEVEQNIEIKGLTYNVNYIKDSNIKSISKESDSCTTEGSNLSCNITLSEVETNEGYHLDGFYINNEKINGEEITIDKDTEIEVRSEVNSYTVTYNYSENGGTTSSKTTDTVNYNESIDLTPIAQKEGYEFVGWNTNKDAEEKINSLTMNTSDITLYAIYKRTDTATFYYYDGTNQTSKTTTCDRFNNNKCNFIVPDEVTNSTGLEDSVYIGLSTNTNDNTIISTYNTDNLVYYAVYKGIYTATFDIGTGVQSIGSTSKSCDSYKTSDGSTYIANSCSITLPTITLKTGYENGVWDKSNTLTNNTTITASATPIVYTITYNANSGTCTDCTSSTYTTYTVENEKTLPTPTRSGYTFAGWKLTTTTGLTGDTDTTASYTSISKGSTGDRGYTANWKQYLYDNVEIGDYVIMTPTQTSYTISPELTGMSEYTGTGSRQSTIKTAGQTINPSLMKYWRVIDKKNDGTIELISEYVQGDESENVIFFYGATGYQKLVGTLNTITAQYYNDTYTVSNHVAPYFREIGYNGQTSNLLSIPTIENSGTTTTTALADNDAVGVEYSGGYGGDTKYIKDLTLVRTAYKAKDSSLTDATSLRERILSTSGNATSSYSSYWLASRQYIYSSESSYTWYSRIIGTAGGLINNRLLSNKYPYDASGRIRPIITLKSGISLPSGDGQSLETAWILE